MQTIGKKYTINYLQFMSNEEIKEESSTFAKGVAKAIIFIVAAAIMTMCIIFNSCTTVKTVTTYKRDTTFIEVHDTVKVKQKDSLAPEKVYNNIDTIFQEIEKDCPNEEAKLPGFKKEIKEDCTHESLSGGSMSVYFPKLKQYVTVAFKGNSGTAIDDGKLMQVNTEKDVKKTVKESFFGKIIGNIEYAGLALLLIIIAFFIGKIT